MYEVVVLGSANVDLVCTVDRIPSTGQTVLARDQARHPGGKGLNQAVAAARAGARTAFIGAVGDDDAGAGLLATMVAAGVDTALVRTVQGSTGTALIVVQDDGDNTIVVAAGANGAVRALTAEDRQVISAASVLVAQLEIPVSAVTAAVTCARAAGTTVVLNAAPAQQLDETVLRLVDVLVVNETEALVLAGGGDPGEAAGSLLELVPAVVATLGARGAAVLTREAGTTHLPAPTVSVVDATGAGDTFTGVLAARLAAGGSLADAAARAVVAASISTEVAGAVPSIPTSAQVDSRLGT